MTTINKYYQAFHSFLLSLLILVFSCSFYSQTAFSERRPRKKIKTNPLVLVINYPYQIWSNDPTKIHLSLFKPNFKPAVAAKVSVNKKFIGKTDKNGILIFDYKPGNNNSHALDASLKEGKRKYEVFKTFASNSRTVSYRADKLYVYTDRGVYNPGQNILIRCMAWQLKGEYSPVPGAKIQLLLQNNSGKVFSGEYIKTNDFGIASSRFILPPNMPEGDYQLVVLYKKAREKASIRVKRFVPPTINISHNLKRYLTDTQNKLTTEIKLSYFAGGKIKASKLIFSVLDKNKKPIFQKRFSSPKPVYRFSLDEKDLNSFRKKLPLESDFKIKLEAIDSYGQTDKVIWDIVYTAKPYTAVLEIDKDAYPKGEKVQILAKVVDLDQQPAANIPLTLEISQLKIKKNVKTDANGVAVLEFNMPAQAVTAIVKSPIMKSPLASRHIPYQRLKPMMSKASEPPKGAGTKTSISVRFDPSYIPIEKVIHVDMTDISGALVVATTIPIFKVKGRYMAKGKVTAPTWGSMLVNLYVCAVQRENGQKRLSVNNVGFITEGQHITFYPDKELEIEVTNFKPAAAPGEKVEFKVKVKGGRGEKCLGISLVDKAVISLLDPLMLSPVKHFYNPQAKVISTGGSGVLTWPVVDRNWGSPWRDIAYSNWGWKGPGSFVSTVRRKSKNGHGKKDAFEGEGEDEGEGAMAEDAETTVPDGQPVPSPNKANKKGGYGKKKNSEKRRLKEVKSQPKLAIIIRKNFPETTLWEPQIITKKCQTKFSVQMPDSITTQKLSIMATDKRGYIGLIHKNILVKQPLFVQSAFPATLTLGDKIKAQAVVRNMTDQKISGKATLISADLNIIGYRTIKLNLDKNESRVIEWEIKANQCGPNQYFLSVTNGKFKDFLRKNIYVLPSGAPDIKVVKGNMSQDRNFTESFNLDKDSDYRVVNLNVSLPNVFPAFQAWWAFKTRPWYSPWAVAATAIMNTAMLEYSIKNKSDMKQINLLKQLLSQASSQLASQQYPSGAWGWYYLADATAPDSRSKTGGENLYFTVYCLRALAEIKKVGLHIDDKVMLKAIAYILKQRTQDGLWSSKGAYFWEVFNESTDHALSAEIFEVLMLSATVLPSAKQYSNDYAQLKNIITNILQLGSEEPMTVGAAIQGLIYWLKMNKDPNSQKLINQSIERLIRLKRRGYWEPHWYHAYGGMVELNARILHLLAEYNPEKYQVYLREGVTWLLSTREAWGTWHNEIGTANAIKALLKTGVFTKEKISTITIKVNNKNIRQIHVDPQDPFLSAAKLRYFELTKWLKPGQNKVEVQYNGNLTASVMLEIKQWGSQAVKKSMIVKLQRSLPEDANLGEPVAVKLTLNAKQTVPVLTIEEPVPANAEIDTSSLEKLLKSKTIASYQVTDGILYLVLIKAKSEIKLEYKMKGIRKGKVIHSGSKIIDSGKGRTLGSIKASIFNVK